MKDLFSALALMIFFAAPVFAQTPSAHTRPSDRVNAARARQQSESRREYQLRNFGTEPGKPLDRRQLEALMAQTEEDFNRILTLHNEIARAISSKNELDFKFVSEATGEINKRASRVQSSLGLELSDEERAAEKTESIENVQPKDALIKLCKQIRAFVTNPTIENPNTVNAEQLTKARQDLESLIRLSDQIKKDADKRGK
ncbi:MAG TPA: hypothetical protein VFY60_01845 [Pyrinomonadaceae bacterium]|nr:hypothetical protein [Pyrinomonadaceae bacterium]